MPPHIFIALCRLRIMKHRSIGAIDSQLISHRRPRRQLLLPLPGWKPVVSISCLENILCLPVYRDVASSLDSEAESSAQPVPCSDHRRRAHIAVAQPTAPIWPRPAEVPGPLLCQRHAPKLAGKYESVTQTSEQALHSHRSLQVIRTDAHTWSVFSQFGKKAHFALGVSPFVMSQVLHPGS